MYIKTLIIILALLVFILYYLGDKRESFKNPTPINKKPKCVCVFDVDGTLTDGSDGKDKDIAIDARASAESCIRGGCAIGIIPGKKLCTNNDPNECKITEYSLGFNVTSPNQVKNASEKIGKNIITGEDWVVNNIHRGEAMKTFSEKISNPKCGVLVDDNILQSCGSCSTFDKNNYCPAPWGSEYEKPDLNLVKKSYGCKFDSNHARDFGDDYAWIPAREIDPSIKNVNGQISQMGGVGFLWNDGKQIASAKGIDKKTWNGAINSKEIKKFNKKCGISLKPINNPKIKSKIKQLKICDLENTPKCKTSRDCKKYMKSNCGNKIITDYTYLCVPKGNSKIKRCSITSRN